MTPVFYKSKKIYYTDKGKGFPLIFLHGFTETSEIWMKFTRSLSREFRVITIDLPGHGKSEPVAPVHSMELMADAVQQVLKTLRIRKCALVGHSMGGYVSLAFAGKHPSMLKGLCLFHSQVFGDTPEGRVNRDRTIQLVKKDKFGFVSAFVPSLFAPHLANKVKKEIGELLAEAKKMNPGSIIAAIEGMKIRPDYTEVVKNLDIPVLFIFGSLDQRIPSTRALEMIGMARKPHALIIRDIAHMGFYEAPELTLAAIRHWARTL